MTLSTHPERSHTLMLARARQAVARRERGMSANSLRRSGPAYLKPTDALQDCGGRVPRSDISKQASNL